MDFCAETGISFEQLLRRIGGNFAEHNRITILTTDDEGCTAEMILGPEQLNGNQEIHGGALYTLADTMAGVSVGVWGIRRFGPSISSVTVNSSFQFMRPLRCGDKVLAKGTYRKMGRSLAVVDVSVTDINGLELCGGTFTYYFIDLDRYRKDK